MRAIFPIGEPDLFSKHSFAFPDDRHGTLIGFAAESYAMTLPESAKALIRGGALAHLATVRPDGSPRVTVIWVG